MVFSFLVSFVENLFAETVFGSILSIAIYIIEIPISFGLAFSFLKLYDDENVRTLDFITLGFNNFSRAWKNSLWIALKMLLPTILIIVSIVIMSVGLASSIMGSGTVILVIACVLLIISTIWAIIKSYYYQISQYIVMENPDITVKEAIEKSEDLMNDNRLTLFGLQFSFIGWAILAMFTFGIGLLWLVPYMQFATIVFYKKLTKTDNNNEVQTQM